MKKRFVITVSFKRQHRRQIAIQCPRVYWESRIPLLIISLHTADCNSHSLYSPSSSQFYINLLPSFLPHSFVAPFRCFAYRYSSSFFLSLSDIFHLLTESLVQYCPHFLLRGPLLSLKNNHGSSHPCSFNHTFPDVRYPELKFYNVDVILDTYSLHVSNIRTIALRVLTLIKMTVARLVRTRSL